MHDRLKPELPIVAHHDAADWPMMHPRRDMPTDRAWKPTEVDRMLQFLKDKCLCGVRAVGPGSQVESSLAVQVHFEVEQGGGLRSVSSTWWFENVRDAGYLGYAWQTYIGPVKVVQTL